MDKTFKQEDIEKFVEFLNTIAAKAKFDEMTVKEMIEFYKLLNYMQKTLLPKMHEHILEVVAVHEDKEAE